MSTTDRTLLKREDSQTTDPTDRLDDASDRVAVLAGRVILSLEADRHVDQEDVADLRDALEDTEAALDEIDGVASE